MERSIGRALLVVAALGAVGLGRAGADDFALKDGDSVVFLGDSITAAGGYGKVVENYTLLRFPDRQVRFRNAGQGGDTAAGGLARLDRDALDRGATVVVVAFGINDIGWGTRADEAHRRAYLDAIRGIVDRCRERGARAFICSAAITAEDPDKAESGFLQAMCDEGMAIARDRGGRSIDVQRVMREIQRKVRAADRDKDPKDRPTLHAPDGVHLNDLGQLAMAYAILKGLDAPSEVSSATVDARGPTLSDATGCRVTNLEGDASRLEFDRLDEGLPVNFGVFGALQFRFIPIPEGLNGYRVAVRGLRDGRYDLLADGRALGAWSADQLAKGVNIASATADGWQPGGPWDAQAGALLKLTDARGDVIEAIERRLAHDLPGHPDLAAIRRQSDEAVAHLDALRRSLVRPRPFHFLVRPSAEAR